VGGSLVVSNVRRAVRKPIALSSANARCTHFTLPLVGVSSADLVSADLAWMEDTAALRRGTLFAMVAESEDGAANMRVEHSYHPCRRYATLARALRPSPRRGLKSSAHSLECRRSDPLIRLEGWLDWEAETRRVRASADAALNHHGANLRAMRAHARATPRALELKMIKISAEAERETSRWLEHASYEDQSAQSTASSASSASSGSDADETSRDDGVEKRREEKRHEERVSGDSVIAAIVG